MKPIFLNTALAALLMSPMLEGHAQQSPLVIADREPVEVMLLRVSASSRCQQDCIIRGAPYSAERITESVQALADGNRIVQQRAEQLYRDVEGRTRVESEWGGRALIQIQDPVANMSYRLYPDSRAGLGMAIGEPAQAAKAPARVVASGTSAGAVRVAEQLGPALAGTASAEPQKTTRSLGTRQMEGTTVEGTLQTTTIPAGQAGNTLPIVTTVETWHSRELKLDLYIKVSDPRSGERVGRVRNLHRGNPPAGLFIIPADYKVREFAR